MSAEERRAMEEAVRREEPVFWANPDWAPMARAEAGLELTRRDLDQAEARWTRFGPLLAQLFPDVLPVTGEIESDLLPAGPLVAEVGGDVAFLAPHLWVKADHDLPVAGSIKARGGIYAVLEVAERVAMDAGLLRAEGDYRALADPAARALLATHHLSVGSTGNLGLSIGIMGAALGFRVTVHMSVEAKEWKKDRLRRNGVEVVEHAGDYTSACAVARAQAAREARAHFIDDENSVALFLGYSVAALRLRRQLAARGISVDADHPLFLYLPCGVGGAPGGITFGARLVFGDAAHAFFAEPTQAPTVLMGLLTGRDAEASVYEWGLKLGTAADGLAVSRPSALVCRMMRPLLAGCYTVSEAEFIRYLRAFRTALGLKIEPSAAAGAAGPGRLFGSAAGRRFLRARGLDEAAQRGTHVVWTTGGRFVPPEIYEAWG